MTRSAISTCPISRPNGAGQVLCKLGDGPPVVLAQHGVGQDCRDNRNSRAIRALRKQTLIQPTLVVRPN